MLLYDCSILTTHPISTHPHPHFCHTQSDRLLSPSLLSSVPVHLVPLSIGERERNPVDFCRACKSSAMVMVMSYCCCHCLSPSLDHWSLIGGGIYYRAPLLCGAIKVSNKIAENERAERTNLAEEAASSTSKWPSEQQEQQ